MHERGPRLKPLIDAINVSVIAHELRPLYKKWTKGDHQVGRPPCNPVGMVLAMVIMLVRGWSRPDLTEFMAKRPEWLRFLRLDDVPDASTWSKLLERVPLITLETILSRIVQDLVDKGLLGFNTVAADSTFVPACHWDDDARWGYVRREERRSLPPGRFLEKGGKTLGFGYRVHVIADARAGLGVSVHVTPANVNDSVAWPALFRKSRDAVAWERVRFFVADSGFDTVAVRASLHVFPTRCLIAPQRLPKRVRRGGFKDRDAAVFDKRSSIERFFSMLKRFLSLHRWGVLGLERVRKHVVLAVLACLIIAWTNHGRGLPVHSVEWFRRLVA